MAVAFVAASHSDAVDQTAVSSLTFSHAPGSTTNGVLYVYVHMTDFTSLKTVNSVTHNGNSLSQIQTHDLSGVYRQQLWRMAAPDASGDVVVTFSAATQEVSASALTYSGVDQTTPNRTPEVQATDETGTTVSDSITSDTDEIVLSSLQTWDDAGSNPEGTAGTERVDIATEAEAPGLCMVVIEVAGASPTSTVSWSKGAGTPELLISVSIQPAAEAGGATSPAWQGSPGGWW